MTQEPKITDASSAQMAAKRHLENEHGKKFIEAKIKKCWYSGGHNKDVWDVEGVAILKKGLFSKEQKPFKYQIDTVSGAVIGFEE